MRVLYPKPLELGLARAVLDLLRRAQDEQRGYGRQRRAARLFDLDEPFQEWGEPGSFSERP